MPRRRCVGCGLIAPKSELVRFALSRAESGRRTRRAVLDRAGTLPGRGAYLCRAAGPGQGAPRPDPGCLAQALRHGGIARTLRSAVTIDAEFVESVSR